MKKFKNGETNRSCFWSNNFGSVDCFSNSNVQLTGLLNEGECSDNSNITFHGSNNKLNLIKSVNIDFQGNENQITCADSSNVSFSGAKNKTNFNKNSNITYKGDANDSNFEDNYNIKFEGNSNQCNFKNNKNICLQGHENEVEAANNLNMNVYGDKHNLDVSGTANHSFKKVSAEENSSINKIKIEVAETFFDKWTKPLNLVSYFGINLKPVTYSVDYIDKTSISGTNYTVGIFDFKIDPPILVKINESQFDAGTFTATDVSSNQVVLRGRKLGVQQTLIFDAKRILKNQQNNVTSLNIDVTTSKI